MDLEIERVVELPQQGARNAPPPLPLLPQERQRLHPNLLCHLLQALEGEVAFAAFDTAHVGAMDAKLVCEGFLAQASLQPVGTQVPAHRLLEITNSHVSQPGHLAT